MKIEQYLGQIKQKFDQGSLAFVLDSNVFDKLLELKKNSVEQYRGLLQHKFITIGEVKSNELPKSNNQSLTDIFNEINPEIVNPGIFAHQNKPNKRSKDDQPSLYFPITFTDGNENCKKVAEECKWKRGQSNYKDAKLYEVARIKNAILITQDNDLKNCSNECGVLSLKLEELLRILDSVGISN